MPVVKLIEISLAFPPIEVLKSLDLVVEEGEYLVILGASGCGKTSLLRLIAGLNPPTSGRVTLNGQDMAGVRPRLRDVALVPQSHGIYPHLRVADSIAMGLPKGLNAADRSARVREAATVVGIETLLDRYPDQLSGGQNRRATIAKALARRATVRLLDEPFSAIDANLKYQLEKDVLHLHHESPGATIHVTHDFREAIRLADRVAVIEGGNVVQCDAPARVRQAPATIGVAAMVGKSSLVTVSVSREDGRWISHGGQAIQGPDANNGAQAILAYYEHLADDVPTPLIDQPGGWHDQERGVYVRPENLRWFNSSGHEPLR